VIAIVDYGAGNLRSVQKALLRAGADARLTSEAGVLRTAKGIVLPGVGSFDHAVSELKQRKLFDVIREETAAGKPYLGLCLGLQLLMTSSDEGQLPGLNLVPGKVIRFPSFLKHPHMGWNTVQLAAGKPKFYYFVHSYCVVPKDDRVVYGRTVYGPEFCSMIRKENIVATQFHPEKSQENGLDFLESYLEEFDLK
jgi:glutamine amidotransferase